MRPDFANTPAHAADNLRFYDRQQAYVSTRRIAPLTKPELTLLPLYAKKNKKRDADVRRPHSQRSTKQHEGPLTARP